MKIPRRYVDETVEDQDFIPKVKGDCPTPEKGVLEGRFSLTNLRPLSDDDLRKQAQRKAAKKGKKQMTDVDQEEDARKGRAPKYDLDLTADEVDVTDDELTKEQKDDDDKVIKVHRQPTKNIVVKNLNGALNLFKADEPKLWEAFSEFITSYYQRNDRQRLLAMAKGPEKDALRAIESLVDAGFVYDKAVNIIKAQFQAEMNITVTDEMLADAKEKRKIAREAAKKSAAKRKAAEESAS